MKQLEIKIKIKLDSEFFDECKKYNWRLDTNGYPRATIKGKRYHLHRYILYLAGIKLPKNYVSDHINRNVLDNRLCNLRMVTRQMNVWNQSKRINCTSKHIGVSYCSTEKRKKRWLSAIEVNSKGKRKQIYLGRFKTEDEAGLAYNKKAKELYGKYGNYNKIK